MKVRVIRIMEYIGEEEWVEKTLARSLQGTHHFGPNGKITAVTMVYERDNCWSPWLGGRGGEIVEDTSKEVSSRTMMHPGRYGGVCGIHLVHYPGLGTLCPVCDKDIIEEWLKKEESSANKTGEARESYPS